jgi:hypothetical protein
MGTLNADGLFVKFGTEKTIANRSGEYKTYGDLREVEVTIDLTTLTATPKIVSDQLFFPTGVRIEEVETFATVASTGASTLSVGLIRTDRTTAIAATGFLAVSPAANYSTLGTKTVYRVGTAGVGTLVGTTSGTIVGYITATGTATPFTTGTVVVRIRYRTP